MNERQRRFCEEYVRDFDARGAAVRAGYRGDGRYGYALLRRGDVARWVKDAVPMRVIGELAAIAFCDVRAFLRVEADGDGGARLLLRDSCEWPGGGAVQSVRAGVRGLELRFHQKAGALNTLARVTGMLAEQNEVEIEDLAELRELVLGGRDD